MGSPLRLTCTLNLPQEATIRCRVLAGEGSGTAWFDRAQLESGALANRHNLLRNANFTVLPLSPAVTIPEDELRPADLLTGWLIGEGSEHVIPEKKKNEEEEEETTEELDALQS